METPTPRTDAATSDCICGATDSRDVVPRSEMLKLETELAAITKQRDDWTQSWHIDTEHLRAERDAAVARAETAESVSDVCNDLIKAQGLELATLRAELSEAKRDKERHIELLKRLQSDYDHPWPNEDADTKLHRDLMYMSISTAITEA